MNGQPSVLVAGALAAQPGNGGHAWVLLHWLLGLRGIGWDAVFVDRMPDAAEPDRAAASWLHKVLDPYGVPFALLGPGGGTIGLSRDDVLEAARRSRGLLNVMGYLDDEEVLAAVPRRAFLDIDPGFGQLWFDLGLADVYARHDAYATVGLHIGQPDCAVPTCGREWITTLPPVVTELWRGASGPSRGVTTVATWRGIYGPIEHRGCTYGLRVHEFRRFAGLATSSPLALEPAIRFELADDGDRAALVARGWQLADPARVAATTVDYRDWIRQSTAELCIAKQLYVRARTGWFSDRSACYLAAGRPVIAQDTGFTAHLPHGEGLLAFSDVDEANAALVEVAASWDHHAAAAQRLACERFDACRVLPPLLAALGMA